MITWVISIVLLCIGSYVAVMNWAVFVNNYILKKQWTSTIPFVGGVLIAIGLVMIPVDGIAKYWWIPLLADWGSLPVVVASIFCAVGRKKT